MSRQEKLLLLQKVFQTGNKSLLEGTNKMVIKSVVIERDGWIQIIPIEPSFDIPEKEFTLKEFEEWKNCIPLFSDLSNFAKKSISE